MTRRSQRISLSHFFQRRKEQKPCKTTTNIILQSPTNKSLPKAQSQSISPSLPPNQAPDIYTHKVLIKRHRIMLQHNIPFPSSNTFHQLHIAYARPLYTPAVRIIRTHTHTHISNGENCLSLSIRQKGKKNRSNRYIGGLRLQPGSLLFWVFFLQLGSLVIQIFRGARA